MWQASDIVNPHLAPGEKDRLVSRITYEPLAAQDPDGNLLPILAEEIPTLENGGLAEDGLSVTWKLKEGIQWSDGEPFTADDVLFTYEYITNPDVGSTSAYVYDSVTRVEVLDDYTVQVSISKPLQNWWLPFGFDRGMIIPRHIFREYAGDNALEAAANLAPVGTGPYRVTQFINDNILVIGDDTVNTTRIIFEPNPYYRDPDKPYFSRVEVQGGGGDANYAAQVLLDDLADFSWGVNAENDLLDQLVASPDTELIAVEDGGYEFLFLNLTDPHKETAEGERSSVQFEHPFFNDLRVRQALRYALDIEAISQAFGYLGAPARNIVYWPEMYDSPNTSIDYDPQKAMALLDEAGWIDSDGDGVREKDGVKLHVLHQTSVNAVRQQIQDVIQENLEAVGFEVDLQAVDASILFSSDIENPNTVGKFHADLQEWGGSAEPALSILDLWTCKNIPQMANNWSGYNTPRYCDEAYDALFAEALAETDPERLSERIIELNDLIIENVVVIPLAKRMSPAAHRSDLAGFVKNNYDFDTWNIADWERIE